MRISPVNNDMRMIFLPDREMADLLSVGALDHMQEDWNTAAHFATLARRIQSR
jgi:hypothetical protein